jgi:putative zinc finger/helix-turn-helix YgiT family protein
MIEFQCEECRKGHIRWEVRKNFPTKVRGYPLVVPEAIIGVCDNCGAEAFDPQETRRWAALFEELSERRGLFLTAEEIRDIRSRLELSIGDFAALVGCTRQTIYNWERADRKSPQLKIADLLLRLVQQSMATTEVDVLKFLQSQAGRAGIGLSLKEYSKSTERITARSREIQFAPAESFDQLFRDCGDPKEVPTLVPYYAEQ